MERAVSQSVGFWRIQRVCSDRRLWPSAREALAGRSALEPGRANSL